ncbi:biotin/lipoyl-binding protein [Limibacter armeniacum]|uniref:HlyD family secretion protein n=1 Tax=Limibacter armeniacum TaxID=466084 RepID=UPI002FE61DA6
MRYTAALVLIGLAACSQPKTTMENVLKGKLKREALSVASKVPGRIVEIRVNEGQNVKAGDTLAIISVPEAEAKLHQAQGAVAAAKAQYEMAFNGATKEQLEQVNAAYTAAKEQFELARKSYERVKKMHDEKLISDQKYDEVYTKFQMASSQLEGTAAKKKEVESGARSEKQRMALGQLKRAEGALEEVNVALNERYLLAPADMRIETVAQKAGELALPGYNIFVGYAQDITYLRFTVQEEEVLKYKVGDELEAYSPFDEKVKVKAKISSIRELPGYANRSSMNPDYKPSQSLYEVKLVPVDSKAASELLTNITMVISKG